MEDKRSKDISHFTREFVEDLAREENLILLGAVDLNLDPFYYKKYLDWIKNGNQAGMSYMENYQQFRESPALLVEGAQSALIFAYNYFAGDKLTEVKKGPPRIAMYARLRDYHKYLRVKSENILKKLRIHSPEIRSRVFVDSGPFLEKALATKSQKGFIGKNSLFIHPELGSYFSMVEIFIDEKVVYDKKESVDPSARSSLGGCGSCKRCQTHCPTGALSEDYVLDARKCISYWTIEHRGPVPKEFWPYFKQYVFGCDICQLACPYNRGASLTEKTYAQLGAHVNLFEIATMGQDFYEKTFGGTPLTRAKKEGLQRNALIALFVTKDPRLEEAVSFLEKNRHLASDNLRETIRELTTTL
jgi:epoxyqueuosine reductase